MASELKPGASYWFIQDDQTGRYLVDIDVDVDAPVPTLTSAYWSEEDVAVYDNLADASFVHEVLHSVGFNVRIQEGTAN